MQKDPSHFKLMEKITFSTNAVFVLKYINDMFQAHLCLLNKLARLKNYREMNLKSWNDHLKYFQEYLNSGHIRIFSFMETEKENILSFHDVEVIREQGKIKTTIYRKPTFRGVYSNFESFIPSVYKFGMVLSWFTIVFVFARIGQNSLLRSSFWKDISLKMLPSKFKKFLDSIHLVKENVLRVEKTIWS